MKTILRGTMLVVVVSAALAFAGTAFATQTLAVSQTPASLTVKLSQTPTDPQPSKITVYVPSTYQVNTAQSVGSKVGTTSGQIYASDVSLMVQFLGQVLVANPAEHTKDLCSPGPHLAVWDLKFTVAGTATDIFVYITATTADEAALGAVKLEVCLPPTDVPPATPGRSPSGAQLLETSITVSGVFTAPAGATRWVSLWTPYAPGTGLPNTAGMVEARSLVAPGTVTLRSSVLNRKKKLVRLSGLATQSGAKVPGASVSLLINSRVRFKQTTNGGGAYAYKLRNVLHRVTTTFFQVRVVAGVRDATATECASPTLPGVRCVSATRGPFTALSRKIKLRL